ncbi:MAG: aminopeptidase P N-terminal domain-containing protein [Clostridiales bacterium]|nr:aminopeptidase P N-terminal domain-containing protein [Clostridiales bacterium]
MSELFFVGNRKKLADFLDSTSVLVLFAGTAPKKRGDENYPFSPDRNFYYATGSDRQKEILFLSKQKEVLYIERDNGELARWVGANLTKQEAKDLTGIETIQYIDSFLDDFASYIFQNQITTVYLDLENRTWDLWEEVSTPAFLFAQELKKRMPAIIVKDIYTECSRLRQKKAPYEIQLIQKAINITSEGIQEMMRYASSGMMEYEIEAYFDFILRKNGIKEKAFPSITASGKNGTILHYSENNCRTGGNDLILCDVGAQVKWYNGDLTRTFPVSGKFTEKQKMVYDIVLEGQKRVMDAIRPGVRYSRLNEILREFYVEKLTEIGLIHQKEELNRYYFHNVSHFLGAETHDVGKTQETVLEKGMVLTVEPGLYIEEWEIGIRIEDDVLVTEDGFCNLSEGLIKTTEEIEAFMSREKNNG